MCDLKDLIDIGISESTLNFYISTKKIMVKDNKVNIIDDSFYDVIFFHAHNNQEMFRKLLSKIKKPKVKKNYEFIYSILFLSLREVQECIFKVDTRLYDISLFKNIIFGIRYSGLSYKEYREYFEGYVKVIDNYINDDNSVLAVPIIEHILRYHDNLYLRCLLALCKKMPDKLEYVVDPSIYRNETVLENYQKYERDLICYLDMGEFDKFEYLSEVMSDIYQEQNPLFFNVVALLLKKIKSAQINKDEIGTRNESSILGEYDSVIIKLLLEGDLYRAKEVIDAQYLKNKSSVKHIVYKHLIDVLMKIISKNNHALITRIELCAVEDNKLESIIKRHPVTSIRLETFKYYEDIDLDPFNEEVNYYKLYEECVSKGDYRRALSAIRKFQYVLRKLKSQACFDYIEKDLRARIQMEEDRDNDIDHYEYYYQLGKTALNNWDYASALENLLHALTYVKKGNPKIYANIAECYYSIGDIDNAIRFYNKAADIGLLYPSDILCFIECLFVKKRYQRVIGLVDVYEKYYFLENPRIHYMASICAAAIRDFKQALSELEIAEMIIKDQYNIDYEFTYERTIIEKMKTDNNTPCYTMDNYIDFELTEYEKHFKERFDTYLDVIQDPITIILANVDQDQETFEEKMEYLFTLLKILVMYGNHEEAKKVYSFIEQKLKEHEGYSPSSGHFTYILKNYKNL